MVDAFSHITILYYITMILLTWSAFVLFAIVAIIYRKTRQQEKHRRSDNIHATLILGVIIALGAVLMHPTASQTHFGWISSFVATTIPFLVVTTSQHISDLANLCHVIEGWFCRTGKIN